DPDDRLVQIRREETLCLPARTHVATRARGGGGMGRAPLLLDEIERPPPPGLPGGGLGESSPGRGLHAPRGLDLRAAVGSGRVLALATARSPIVRTCP